MARRSSLRHGAAVLLLAAVLAPAPAWAAAPAAQGDAASVGQVDTLLSLLFPTERLTQLNVAAWREELAGGFDGDPALVAREKAEPGLRAAVIAAGTGEVERAYRDELGAMVRDLRPVYASLNRSDADTLIALFRSPTGRKLASRLQEGVANSTRLTVKGVAADGREQALASLDQSDMPTLVAFGQTPAAQRARALAPRIAEISERHMTAVTRRLETAVPQARDRALGTAPSTAPTTKKASGQ